MIEILTSDAVNGVDVSALEAFAEAISADAEQGLVRFSVVTRWAGQTASKSTVSGYDIGGRHVDRHFEILADEPRALLGEDNAPNPQELLMAAINACMTVGYVAGAAVRKISLETLEIETTGQLDLRGFLGLSEDVPPGYETIDYTVRISGDGTAEQFSDIHRTVMKTSPNYFNISRPINMNGNLVII